MRQSADFIAQRRRDKKNTILLTGGTGFLGSHLAVELLRRGHFVILLCRSKDGLSAEQRMRQLFDWFDLRPGGNYRVVEGQITQPRFGLDEQTYAYLKDHTDEIFHCVAETAFSQTKQSQLEAVNVEGARHALQLAVESGCYYFHHMSTAYVAGQRHGRCEEEYVPQEHFHNAYEQTKHVAEGLVLETCRANGIRANIYRPSIVYGDSRTGKSLLFNAFYAPMKLAHYLQTIWERDFAENEGRHATSMGVTRSEDGVLQVSIRIERAEMGVVNLIPIDFLTQATLAIMEDTLDGGIFHIVNDRQDTLDELLVYMRRIINIDGIRLVGPGHLTAEPRNALEKLVAGYLDVYQPYFYDDRTFETTKAQRILARHRITCPRMDDALFSRCIRYAIEVDWGRQLFQYQQGE